MNPPSTALKEHQQAMDHHQWGMAADENQGEENAIKRDEKESLTIARLSGWKFYCNPFYHYQKDEDPPTTMDTFVSEDASPCGRRIKTLEDQQAQILDLVSSLRSELSLAKTRIAELRSVVTALQGKLESESRAWKMLECANRVLSKELENDIASRKMAEGGCERGREERVWRVLEQRAANPNLDGCRLIEPNGEKKAELSVAGGGSVGWTKLNLTENPHIQRGMKGLVEFSRVVRQGGPKGRRRVPGFPSETERHKALLRQYILKQ